MDWLHGVAGLFVGIMVGMTGVGGGSLMAPILILLFEHSSGYARFHAYQSLMTCLVLGCLHILFLWSSFLSWLIFLFDLLLLGSLASVALRPRLTHADFKRIATRTRSNGIDCPTSAIRLRCGRTLSEMYMQFTVVTPSDEYNQDPRRTARRTPRAS